MRHPLSLFIRPSLGCVLLSCTGVHAQTGNDPLPAAPGWTAEVWGGLPFHTVADLTANDVFYNEPLEKNVVHTTSFRGYGPNNGTRLRGYVTAPATGEYRFWVSGVNSVELWLSSDETKYRKRRIARMCASIGTAMGFLPM